MKSLPGCDDVDECKTIFPCKNNGTCINEEGSYNCFCNSDYYGDNCEYSNMNAHQWEIWGHWSHCTATCGSGFHISIRLCPTNKCIGPSYKKQSCAVNIPCESSHIFIDHHFMEDNSISYTVFKNDAKIEVYNEKSVLIICIIFSIIY
jgi:hypothetical protein